MQPHLAFALYSLIAPTNAGTYSLVMTVVRPMLDATISRLLLSDDPDLAGGHRGQSSLVALRCHPGLDLIPVSLLQFEDPFVPVLTCVPYGTYTHQLPLRIAGPRCSPARRSSVSPSCRRRCPRPWAGGYLTMMSYFPPTNS